MKRLTIQRVAFLLISILLLLALVGMGGKPSSGNMVFPADSGQAYASLADAMQSDGFSTHCLPTWIPEDYSIIHNDTEFFIYTNTGDPCAVWQMDAFLCSIDTFDDGDRNRTAITEDELLAMIHSIKVDNS